ncbi:MAG: radical SAM family heme chaperone HemW [Spirochaetales bacterium]|nr:radical SAM family heme chaperone HemW [Spirochaetales bacterium]
MNRRIYQKVPGKQYSFPVERASVYIHIPFCTSICDYCDFFSVIPNEPHQKTGFRPEIEKTIEKTMIALRNLIERFSIYEIPTVYIGGGTPGILTASERRFFFDYLQEVLPSRPKEFSMETNPETITRELLEFLVKAGVNRLSIGIQTLNEDSLRYIGRKSGPESGKKALDLIGKYWSSQINIDLVTGIPGSTLSTLQEDLKIITKSSPEHISVYPLTVEEGTALAHSISLKEKKPPDRELSENLWFEAVHYLTEAGFRNYEVSNFALPGAECLHNLSYWNLLPYLGVGPSAVSSLEIPESNEIKFLRLTFPPALPQTKQPHWNDDWYEAGTNIQEDIIAEPDSLFEILMMGLRTEEGISLNQRPSFLDKLSKIAPRTLNEFVNRGTIGINSDSLKVSGPERFFLDDILRSFLAEIRSA